MDRGKAGDVNEAARRFAETLAEQADRQQEAGRALAQESLGAYMDFLDATFSQYLGDSCAAVSLRG